MTPPPSSPSSSEAYSHRLPWPLIIQIGGLVLAIVVLFLLGSHYPILNWIGDVRKQIESLGLWSGIVYPIAYAICNVLLLPGGVLSVGGGFIFGLWWGFLIVLVGNLLGAATAFCIARRLGRRRIEKLIDNSRRLRVIDRAIERQGWKIVVLSQLNPLAPSSLLNYLYGLTRVPLHRCLLWVALGQTPGLFLYVFIGTLGQFGVEMARGTKQPVLHDYLVWGSGFMLTICTTYMLGRLAKHILAEVETELEPNLTEDRLRLP
jgi:uncharacterized membrane protein YdjX (TVP38/TMEM64 family)